MTSYTKVHTGMFSVWTWIWQYYKVRFQSSRQSILRRQTIFHQTCSSFSEQYACLCCIAKGVINGAHDSMVANKIWWCNVEPPGKKFAFEVDPLRVTHPRSLHVPHKSLRSPTWSKRSRPLMRRIAMLSTDHTASDICWSFIQKETY